VASKFGYGPKYENERCWLNVNELFESTKKRRKGSGRVVGSYDSGAHSKKDAEIKLWFRFEQDLIEKKD
jgi:hypothetical protein